MTITRLPCVEINPEKTPKHSIIWLHGLGANGHDFAPAVPELQLPKNLSVRFVFPHAPQRPVTINSGMLMPAWYDIYGLSPDTPEDEEGIQRSEKAIHSLIEYEISLGIPSHQIVLAGFSQGGSLALYTGLRYSQTLAGIIALSCYLPSKNTLLHSLSPANKNTPLLLGHGSLDELIPEKWGKDAYCCLEKLDYKTQWHSYQIGHGVNAEEFTDIGKWLQETVYK